MSNAIMACKSPIISTKAIYKMIHRQVLAPSCDIAEHRGGVDDSTGAIK
jgi:hypothetical protein